MMSLEKPNREARVSFRISEEMDKRIREIELKRDWSRSQILREALREFVEAEEEEAKEKDP